MYVFSHLQKSAGTTITRILRRTFGLRHLDVMQNCGRYYTEKHLEYDIAHFINPYSIAGHCLRPHIDFGQYEDRMQWFSVIRDPLDRCISHYQHLIEKTDENASFSEWIQRDTYRNLMVRFFGGTASVQKAIDSIHSKNMRVIVLSGQLEIDTQYIFSDSLCWRDLVANPGKSSRMKEEIKSSNIKMEALISANELDLELFEYLKNTQCKPFDIIDGKLCAHPRLNSFLNMLYRNIIYRPVKKRLRNTGIR